MKKVLALVLAVMMLSTMAFAKAAGTAGGDVAPGGKIKLERDSATQQMGAAESTDADISFEDGYNVLTKALNTDNYKVGRIKYNDGKGLIDEVYIDDDDEQLVIAFAQDYEYTKPKDFDIEISLDGRSREAEDITVCIKGDVGYDLYTVTLNDDEFDLLKDESLSNDVELKNGLVTFDKGSVTYSTLTNDFGDEEELGLEVRVYDGGEYYLYCDTSADTDVLKANADSDAEMYFYNFKGEPTFDATAKLYFYDADEDSYVYEINNGRLTEVGKYDDDEGCWVVKARTLGQYVMSTEELVNAADEDGDTSTDADVENPDTGANDVVGIAAALGVVALVSAAAVSLKK